MERELQQRLLYRAYKLALNSKDPSTVNGALLVEPDGRAVTEGWNRLPDDVKDLPERWVKPDKYLYVEHAERDCIYKAAALGKRTSGLTMVAAWAACPDCAKAIIGARIRTLVTHKQAFDRSPEYWRKLMVHASSMLQEAGVEVIYFDGTVRLNETVKHSGEEWVP